MKVTLYPFDQSLVKLEGWENIVSIVSCDMRCWNAPEEADILVGVYLLIVWSLFSFPLIPIFLFSFVMLCFRLVSCWVLLVIMNCRLNALMEPKGF